MAKKYFTLWVYHILFTHLSVNGHLDSFHTSTVVNSIAKNIDIEIACGHLFSFFLGIYLILEYPDYMVNLYLAF